MRHPLLQRNKLIEQQALQFPEGKTEKYFYIFLGNNFFTVFCGGPLVVEAPGQLPSFPPPFNPVLRFISRMLRLLPTPLPSDTLNEGDSLELSGSYLVWEN